MGPRLRGGTAEGSGKERDLLGGKGANLAEMPRLGLPVPPGFTVTTEVCTWLYAHDRQCPQALRGEVEAALARVGELTGRGCAAEHGSTLQARGSDRGSATDGRRG